jgi:hypothetical protein
MLTFRSAGVVAALIVIVAAPTLADAQISKKGAAGYLFKPKFTRGTVAKYTLTAKSAGPQTANISSSFTQKVLGINGQIVDIEITSSPVMVNGKPMGKQDTHKMQWDMKSNKAVGQSQAMFGGIPNKPLKVGESYKAKLPMGGPMGGPGGLEATYKFIGLKNVGGKQVAQLDIAIPKTANGSMQMGGSGTMFLLASDASLVNVNMKMTMSMPAQQGQKPMTVTTSLAIKRV